MKGLAFYGIRDLRYETVPDPRIESPTDVIVKVKAAGLCGSDFARYKKLGPYIPGTVWGHEFSGLVTETGSAVRNVKPGDRVAACPSIVCNTCHYCISGEYAKCVNLHALGALQNGGFGDYTKVPCENLIKLSDNISYEEGAMVEPSAVALHAIMDTNIRLGDCVAVSGCGSIGETVIIWAKTMGVRIIALDIDNNKLEHALHIGADAAINSLETIPEEEIRKFTEDGADIIFECAGNETAAATALSLVKRGGQVMFVGLPYSDIQMPRHHYEKIVRHELIVRGSFGAVSVPFPGREWFAAVAYISQKKVDVAAAITHRDKLSKGPAYFEKILENPTEYGKVMLFPEWDYD